MHIHIEIHIHIHIHIRFSIPDSRLSTLVSRLRFAVVNPTKCDAKLADQAGSGNDDGFLLEQRRAHTHTHTCPKGAMQSGRETATTTATAIERPAKRQLRRVSAGCMWSDGGEQRRCCCSASVCARHLRLITTATTTTRTTRAASKRVDCNRTCGRSASWESFTHFAAIREESEHSKRER